MKSLVEIVQGSKVNGSFPSGVSTYDGLRAASLTLFSATMESTKARQLADETSAIVTDTKFLGELQDDIGLPRAGETEDAFVARAKAALRNKLHNKLK